MKTKVQTITETQSPRLYALGVRATVIVSTDKVHHLFYANGNGKVVHIYGGHSGNSEPSKKIIAAARAAVVL